MIILNIYVFPVFDAPYIIDKFCENSTIESRLFWPFAITENFIRDPYKNELYLDIDFNPIEKYYDNDETLKSICNGNTNMNKACAAELYSLYDKEKLIGFFSNREYNFEPYKELIIANGFKIEIIDGDEDILATMADLLVR